MEGGDEKKKDYKRKKKKQDEGIEKKGETKWESRIELVIELLSNIKEQTSSDFAKDDIFNTTSFLFILLSSESFLVFVWLTKAQFSDPLSTNSLILGFLGLSPST